MSNMGPGTSHGWKHLTMVVMLLWCITHIIHLTMVVMLAELRQPMEEESQSKWKPYMLVS